MRERRRDLTEPVTVIGVGVAALVAVVAVVQGLGTAGVATAQKPVPTTTATTPAPTTTTTTASPPAGVKLATAVYDLRAGTFVSRSGEDTPFAAESLTKLLIATDLAAAGKLAGDNLPKIQRMLSTSDDKAANQLWTSDGGPQIVTRAVRSMGLRQTVPPRDPGRWGDTTTTAADVVRIYQHIVTKMPAAQRDVLLADLATTARAADGTNQDFGITAAVPAGQWWAKQAWACCRPAWDVHTTGLVGADRRYVVVALSQQPLAGGFGGASKVMTSVAKNLVAGLEIQHEVVGGA
ncbi:serine hydrolase [Kutzneria kofuensis]|uniref:Beta-lactamase class A n=1 Tax=Kutzneria kofuensis TaxID=103725 RepID=A0A7W9KCC6_9PSEU|nr:serine hydrolase [Kutzneria kofuensis]MBB5890009.1 beta-lactamase class A [Kutzneria kofuensis]